MTRGEVTEGSEMRIDNHAHVFRHPGVRPPEAVSGAAYAPPQVSVVDYFEHLSLVECARGVLVQPSAYGTADHQILLSALRSAPDQLRGVACVPPGTHPRVLEDMHRAGVRATRVQDGYPGGVPVSELNAVADMVSPLGWHVEVWSDLRQHVNWFADAVRRSPVPVVLDHMGHLPSTEAPNSPAVRMVESLLAEGTAWVTLSGLERLAPRAEPPEGLAHEALDDRARRFIMLAPDRCMWGTDWPHVGLGSAHPDAAELIDRVHRWVQDADVRSAVFGANAQRLYFSE